MDFSALMDALPEFFFDEPTTSERESIEIVEWKEVLEKIMVELEKEPQLMEKLNSFLSSSLSDEKLTFMRCLLTNSTVKKMIGKYAAQCKQQIKMGTSGKKNATKAVSIRLQGNSLFVKEKYLVAFKIYTRGLMFAKDDDEETPLLYANRSAVYSNLKQHENALEDIERALQFGYGKIKPIGKLLIRKGFSLLSLGRDDQVKELLDANMPSSENEPDFAQWQQLKKQTENVNRQIIKRNITMSQFQDVLTIRTALTNKDVFRPHGRYSWLNAKIDLCYDKEKGYHLVSKEEMKYGEIVALSKPYVCLDPKRDSYERCHYCMVPCFETPKYFSDKENLAQEPKLSPDSLRMVTPLPCSECSNVLYCSEACRTAAWTAYHCFECAQMAILRKIDSKSHLALRMFYMFGSLEENSPTLQMIEELKTTAVPGALMIDQQAYLFFNLNPIAEISNLEMNIECTLTVGFLLKLLQMSELLVEPNVNIDDREYIHQEAKAYTFLFRHINNLNETLPFTDPITNRTVAPSPVLSVDGMKSMMNHSCEATVATSSLLSESLGSNVKLLYATGDIPVGTVLTLAYDTEDNETCELLYNRKYQLFLRYGFDCTCTRCVREERDYLDIPNAGYFPIACSLCGSLMVRAAGQECDSSSGLGGSYRCSSTNGCTFKYSAQQMKNVYERVGKMLESRECSQTYSTYLQYVGQLKTTIESTATLLYSRSTFLAQLYGRMASGYLLITMAPISNRYSDSVYQADNQRFTSSTNMVHRDHLTAALLYLNKALDILESMMQGPGVKTQFTTSFLDVLFKYFDLFEPIIHELGLFELLPPIEQVRRRYEALLKMTAYDTMVVSSLADKE